MRKTEDLTGKKFGLLTVLSKTEEVRGSNVVWECRCDCGNIVRVRGNSLSAGNTKSSGNTRSCGCLLIRDLTGQRFGKLTAVRVTEERQNTQTVWECKCDCGNLADVVVGNLLSGKTQSCGCLRSRKTT